MVRAVLRELYRAREAAGLGFREGGRRSVGDSAGLECSIVFCEAGRRQAQHSSAISLLLLLPRGATTSQPLFCLCCAAL